MHPILSSTFPDLKLLPSGTEAQIYFDLEGTERPLLSCFGIFLILMFTFRFFLEYTKINEGIDETAILNMGQILSIPFIIAGVVIAYVRYKPKAR
jgi:prolipoprotein diacylglyceryltransferase